MKASIIINEAGDRSKVGYVRVSSVDQNEARQIDALKNLNLYKIYVEKVSAKDTNRPLLQEMLGYIRNGDTVYILDFSRLARSARDLLDLVEFLKEKGVSLISLKENIDTSTPTGKMMLTVIGAMNAFERDTIRARQREGIDLAKAAGKYKGRVPIEKPPNFDEVLHKVIYCQMTNKEAMRELGLSKSTYYTFKNQYLKDVS